MVRIQVREHSVSIIFELGLIYLVHDLDIRCVGRVHEVHRIEVHHPIREAMQLLHQVLDPFLLSLPRIMGLRRLAIDDLDEQHQDMLELLAHDILNVQHVLKINLVALQLEDLLQVVLVGLHLHHGLQLTNALRVNGCIESTVLLGILCAFPPLDLDLCCDLLVYVCLCCLLECGELFVGSGDLLVDLVDDFFDVGQFCLDQLVHLVGLLLHRDDGYLLRQHLVVPPDDLIVRPEVLMKRLIVRVKGLDIADDIVLQLPHILNLRQLLDQFLYISVLFDVHFVLQLL